MRRKKASIQRRILLPMLLIIALQALLFFGTFIVGGTMDRLQSNAFDIFAEKVSGRQADLENDMVQRWSNVQPTADFLLSRAETYLEEKGYSVSDLLQNRDDTNEFLEKNTDEIIALLRRNSVTGVFLILNSELQDGKRSGLYLRVNDPYSTSDDYTDLLAERCPSSITQKYNIALDSLWQPQFDFSDDSEEGKNARLFFSKPAEAAENNPELSASDLGYWSPSFHLNPNNTNDSTEIITYSIPMIMKDGTVFGVIGVELSVNYLRSLLSPNELYASSSKAGYLLAMTDTNPASKSFGEYDIVISSGSYLTQALGNHTSFSPSPDGGHDHFQIIGDLQNNSLATSYMVPLDLYNTHTPFENNQWYLVGVIDREALLEFSSQFSTLLVLALAIAFSIGCVGAFIVGKRVTRPIRSLVNQLRQTNPSEPIQLNQLNILEIDELSESIQTLSADVIDASSKLSTILEYAGISIAAFEYNYDDGGNVLFTKHFFEVLRIDLPNLNSSNQMDSEEFKKILHSLDGKVEDSTDDQSTITYNLGTAGEPYWCRLRIVHGPTRVLGVVTDVTQEIRELRKIEYDRDYDLLTNLFNRRAFQRQIDQLFKHPEHLKISAFIMLDLDNLKFINDTYGHDYGDEYIRLAADALKKTSGPNALLSRLSGDEFVLFLHGFETREEIRNICEVIQNNLRTTKIYLPDRSSSQIRASAGIAWYPDDSDQYDDLVRYADFAMYMVKRTNKGSFTEFSIETYNKEAYLLECREELNNILMNDSVDYQFQPIVDAKNGSIHGFEALMRIPDGNIKNPSELISLARSQSKLPQIERLTFYRALECYTNEAISNYDFKIFVNSLANQVMTDKEFELFESKYAAYLNRLVIEITEEERADRDLIDKKMSDIIRWGAELALDDYGVGYNGEGLLVDLSPGYVKLDMSLVRNIHADENRQEIIKGLISYCKDRGIKIIAEGVETYEEMAAVVYLGADYLQGFYLARPAYHPNIDLPQTIKNEIISLSQKK